MDNKDNQEKYEEIRPDQQEQPHHKLGTSSRPILQPIILGDISLPSATTQTTVGAAGGATALPATPTGYLTINIGNTNYVLPFYAAS